MKIEVEVPKFEVALDREAIMRAAGEALVADARARLESGLDARGNAIPPAKDPAAGRTRRRGGRKLTPPGRPLIRTGKLLASLAFRRSKKGGTVKFYGRHDPKRTNAQVAWYQIQRRLVLVEANARTDAIASAAAQAEIEAQTADRRARIESVGI